MASKEEQEKAKLGKGRGFAGLSSMVSDVDTSVSVADQRKSNPSLAGNSAGTTRLPPQVPPLKKAESSRPTVQRAAEQQSGGSSAGKWFLGIGLVIGMLWLISSMSNAPSPNRSPKMPDQLEVKVPNPFDKFDKQPNRSTEEIPPVGTNLVLAPAQLRYCLSEAIRIDAARAALNNYRQFDVDRFNAMINDYNNRCGNFRYRPGSLENARTEIERNRSALEADGHARFSR